MTRIISRWGGGSSRAKFQRSSSLQENIFKFGV